MKDHMKWAKFKQFIKGRDFCLLGQESMTHVSLRAFDGTLSMASTLISKTKEKKQLADYEANYKSLINVPLKSQVIGKTHCSSKVARLVVPSEITTAIMPSKASWLTLKNVAANAIRFNFGEAQTEYILIGVGKTTPPIGIKGGQAVEFFEDEQGNTTELECTTWG